MKQLPPCRLKDKERVPVKCNTCGKEFTVSYSQIKRRGPDYKWHCRSCSMNNLSKEEKEKRSNKIKDALGTKTAEEKQAMTEKRLQTIMTPEFRKAMKEKVQTCWKNKSEEELKRISEKASKNTQRIWDTMDKDVKEKRLNKMFVGFDNWWTNLSDEEKKERGDQSYQHLKDYWDNTSEEDKINNWKKLVEWRNNLSGLDKIEYENKRIKSIKEHWKNVPENERKLQCANANKSLIEWRKNISDEEYNKLIRLRIQRSAGKNDLHLKFENQLMLHGIKFNDEYTVVNKTKHTWDYAILNDDNEVVMLVDLDGGFYHADKYDYDGIHGIEERDEIRGLSIPDNIKWTFIQEYSFDETFDYMLKILHMNYDEFIQERFNEYRNIPFPIPSYADIEIMKSYSSILTMKCNDKYHVDMSINTRIGDRVVYNFYHSIWQDCYTNDISPYDAWSDDNILKDLINGKILIHSYLNKNKILQGFNISPIGKRTKFISPGFAKMVINKYLKKYYTIFNPNNRYGEILLGAISLNKQYIGIEENGVKYNETMNLISFLNKYKVNMNVSVYQHIQTREYECLFTWVDSDEQIELYLNTFHCRTYLFITDTDTKYEYKNINKYKLITKEV